LLLSVNVRSSKEARSKAISNIGGQKMPNTDAGECQARTKRTSPDAIQFLLLMLMWLGKLTSEIDREWKKTMVRSYLF
jgi:hypothetical protein